jgi:hypothetical protein
MRGAMMLVAALCLVALAATSGARGENTEAGAQSSVFVNRQSAVVGPRSPVIGGADAITIPQMLSYQGKLTDINGVPVPDSTWSLVFRLYTVASGGSPFWNETQPVKTTGGLFSVLLGSVTPIGLMPDAGTVYLGMSVSGGAELSPRTRIVSTAYAYKADTANYAGAAPPSGVAGGDLAGSYPSPTVDGLQGRAVIGTAPGYGQVLKWNGNQWAPANDSIGSGGGTVTSVSQTTGVICSPNPITTTGTVGLNVTYTDGRYVDVAGDSITDDLAIQDELRVYDRARIGPNCQNTATQSFAVGNGCIASGNRSSVLGGWQNQVSGSDAAIAGGAYNLATAPYAFVGSGYADTAVGRYSGVLSGRGNVVGRDAGDSAAVIAGGYNNSATSPFATICGGVDNRANNLYAVVAGGIGNLANATYGMVGGGYMCTNRGSGSFIGVGRVDSVEGDWAVCGGGEYNYVNGDNSVIAGGRYNRTTSTAGAIGGGANNTAGPYAAVPGGYLNAARGYCSFAGGRRARANHDGSFSWSDYTVSEADSLYTTNDNQFRVRARGGVWFYSNLARTNGVYLAPNANSWAGISYEQDGSAVPVDRHALLERLVTVPVREYGLDGQNESVRHIGPTAQEFGAALGYGETETGINLADADGVLLAAVQALYEQNQAQQAEIEALKSELKRR